MTTLRDHLPYVAVQWYNRDPRQGAIYLGRFSFHWALNGPVVYRDGRVQTLRERPRRTIVAYYGIGKKVLYVPLWRTRTYCEHGFRKAAWWHRCDYVTTANPDGRVPERELYPEDYDENGVHWIDRTCFCDLKPEYDICSMHAEDDDPAHAYAATAGQSPTNKAEAVAEATPKSSSAGPAETAAETE